MLSALTGPLQHWPRRGHPLCFGGRGPGASLCPRAVDKGEGGRPVGTDRDGGAEGLVPCVMGKMS